MTDIPVFIPVGVAQVLVSSPDRIELGVVDLCRRLLLLYWGGLDGGIP